jgi:hypothetical protein
MHGGRARSPSRKSREFDDVEGLRRRVNRATNAARARQSRMFADMDEFDMVDAAADGEDLPDVGAGFSREMADVLQREVGQERAMAGPDRSDVADDSPRGAGEGGSAVDDEELD